MTRKVDAKWFADAQSVQSLADHLLAGLFIYELSEENALVLVDANALAQRISGVRLNEFKGVDFDTIYPNASKDGITDAFKEVLRSGVTYSNKKLRYGEVGHETVSDVRAFKLDSTHLAVLFNDRSELEAKTVALRHSEERFKILADASTEGIVFSDKRVILDCNKAMLKIFGYKKGELVGEQVAKLVDDNSHALVNRRITEKYDLPYQLIGRRKDGQTFPIEACGKRVTYRGEPVRLTVIRDRIAEARASDFESKAMTDELTRLPNRRFLAEALDAELKRACKANQSLSLVVADIDHFKKINDIYGHLAGDHVLSRMGEILLESKRRTDTVARYGGEEFCIVLVGANADAAKTWSERLRKKVESATVDFEGQTITLTASFGIAAISSATKVESTALFERADEALYEAKHGGRNRVVVAIPVPESS